jgi:ABC-2 type transport system ATP-binding protein
MKTTLVEAKEITKRFSGHTALDGVSVQVPEGSIFGLLGPNGAGKTTLIRIINLITAPDEGELLFKGIRIKRKDIEQIGYLPEERGLYKKMKVGEQALYLAQLKGLSKYDANRRLKEWFERFDLTKWWNRKVEELSKGMQQKIQFIVTVLHRPSLLIFDEPFSGFDPINVNILKEEILKLKKDGATIIFSTHNMASVEELCDSIALINKSKTILQGDVIDIKRAYTKNHYRIEYSGKETLRPLISEPFRIIDEEKANGHFKSVVSFDRNSSVNELISGLMPHITIHAFEEILPSMNDIFISKVQEDKGNE